MASKCKCCGQEVNEIIVEENTQQISKEASEKVPTFSKVPMSSSEKAKRYQEKLKQNSLTRQKSSLLFSVATVFFETFHHPYRHATSNCMARLCDETLKICTSFFCL